MPPDHQEGNLDWSRDRNALLEEKNLGEKRNPRVVLRRSRKVSPARHLFGGKLRSGLLTRTRTDFTSHALSAESLTRVGMLHISLFRI